MKTSENVQSQKLALEGKEYFFSLNQLALQANASVVVTCGGTTVLSTVTCSAKEREDIDYFPLYVEYVERLYAGGIIKGSRWVKREGRPSDEAILAARLIDRSIRPLFPENFRREVQVVVTVLSVDQENDPVLLGALATSAALTISDIPWNGPLGIVRVGLKSEVFFVNPAEVEKEYSELDLVVASGKEGVVMIEAGANQVPEEVFWKGIEFAEGQNQKIIAFLERLRRKVGKPKISFVSSETTPQDRKRVEKIAGSRIQKLVEEICRKDKEEQSIWEEVANLEEEVKAELEGEIRGETVKEVLGLIFKKKLREKILSGRRPGGRDFDQIRELKIDVGLLPRTHGSALFQRGKTQVLTVTTLGSPSLKQLIESPEGEEIKRYIHHYSMPPYATGEVGKMGAPARREIGHGALAERALLPVIPPEERFPYTIRLVSEVLSSNGSTSMASVCGSTLSLMDAGVPISDPVAGISIGMVTQGSKFVLLTDIAGIEDFNGDMDFKVAGTRKGITAVQTDIKISGLSLEMIRKALEKAKAAREFVLDRMQEVIAKPREKISQYAPKVVVMSIPEDKIGDLIGPGGKTIRGLIAETGCDISIEDDGTVSVTGLTQEAVAAAVERIKSLTKEVAVGEVLEGIVKRIQPFGAFVEYSPGKEGLIHISRFGGAARHPGEVLKVGQKVKVVVREIDEFGRVNLDLSEPIKPSRTRWPATPRHSRFSPRFRRLPPKPHR